MKVKSLLKVLSVLLCTICCTSCNNTDNKKALLRENGWYQATYNGKDSLSLKPIVTAKDFINLKLESDSLGIYVITGQINKQKLHEWIEGTEKAIGEQIAFIFNDTIISCPKINQRLDNGSFQISTPPNSNIDIKHIYQQLEKTK